MFLDEALSTLFDFLSLRSILSEYFATISDNLGLSLTSETGDLIILADSWVLLDDGLLKS